MSREVSGADAISRRLKFLQKKGINVVERWLRKWGNKYAVAEKGAFHKGQPGYWTGTIQRSIGCSNVRNEGQSYYATIGPGQATAERAGFGMFGNSWIIQAMALEHGSPYKAHFLGYRDNPMFELWASQHGFKTRNKAGQPSGGMVVGGKPGSVLQRGLHYKSGADATVMPQIAASRKDMVAEIEQLATQARATVR